MKRNPTLEAIRKETPEDVRIYVDMSCKLAERIEDILRRKGKTQRAIARELKKSESEISKWLSGEHNITLRSLAKLQAVLGEPLILFPQDMVVKA